VQGERVELSLVIPVHNEEGCIETTAQAFHDLLATEKIVHEIIIVNDNSTDQTEAALRRLSASCSAVRYVNRTPPPGFGLAVRRGLEEFRGNAVAIVMGDASDRPEDLVRFYRTFTERGVDCVFGSRFMRESRVHDYPLPKLILNRLANTFIQVLFGLRYNDTTNAFKLYSRSAIEGLKPFLSHHFNLTVELPLKAIVRGFSYEVLPNDWTNRKTGEPKLRIKEMGSRYMFIVLYCLLEKLLSRGDYRNRPAKSLHEAADATPLDRRLPSQKTGSR
jgi:dolichol-phosphate mannosyltransferase